MTDTDVTRLPPAEFDALMADIRHDRERFHAFMDGVELGIGLGRGEVTAPDDREAFRQWMREAYAERVEGADGR